MRELAPAKVNLVLRVGSRAADGLHELCSLFASIDLCDELWFEPANTAFDSVSCPAVAGSNLAERALSVFRRACPDPLGPLAVTIKKRIPIAAGLGGGSADAAAVLRVANRLAGSPFDTDQLRQLAFELGSDVPSQITPGPSVVCGRGELVTPVTLAPLVVVLVLAGEGLATASVYHEADRLGLTGSMLDPARVAKLAGREPAVLAAELANDLQPAALSLRPELGRPIQQLLDKGALAAQLSGSGPTAFGVFCDLETARTAAASFGNAFVARTRSVEGVLD